VGLERQPLHHSEGSSARALLPAISGRMFALAAPRWPPHARGPEGVDCEDAFKVLAPQVVTEEVDGLVKAGFAHVPALRADVQAILDHHVPHLSRLIRSIDRVLEWEVVWSGVDPLLTQLYDRGIFLLFTRTAQIVIAATALIGFVVFVMNLRSVGVAIHDITQTHRLLCLLPLFAVAVALHELGHGFAAKAFGREIQRIGAGWHWFAPIVFVDSPICGWLGDGPASR
jgi:hypothetical protein